MSRGKCICDAVLRADGSCPHGCELHRKPHQRRISEETAATKREKSGTKIGISRADLARGAAPLLEPGPMGGGRR
jgi:hypothetical protein